MTARTIANMWEVVAMPGSADALVKWVFSAALPELSLATGLQRSEVYRGADNRVVVITLWSGEPVTLSEPPEELVAQPPMSWDFEQVQR
jgi:hypothetical protein